MAYRTLATNHRSIGLTQSGFVEQRRRVAVLLDEFRDQRSVS